MTLEISEIGVRLSVGASRPASEQATDSSHQTLTPQEIEELIKTCTQQVLQTLRMLGER
jgi:hypothetical protein